MFAQDEARRHGSDTIVRSPFLLHERMLVQDVWYPAGRCTVRKFCGRILQVAVAFPPALLIVLVGLAITIGFKPKVLSSMRFGPSVPKILRIRAADWRPAIIRAALPQLPVRPSLLSLVALCATSLCVLEGNVPGNLTHPVYSCMYVQPLLRIAMTDLQPARPVPVNPGNTCTAMHAVLRISCFNDPATCCRCGHMQARLSECLLCVDK